jgi:hypothetical protein
MVPPDRAAGGEWEMRLSATRDIDAGEEVLLSYGAPAPCQSPSSRKCHHLLDPECCTDVCVCHSCVRRSAVPHPVLKAGNALP